MLNTSYLNKKKYKSKSQYKKIYFPKFYLSARSLDYLQRARLRVGSVAIVICKEYFAYKSHKSASSHNYVLKWKIHSSYYLKIRKKYTSGRSWQTPLNKINEITLHILAFQNILSILFCFSQQRLTFLADEGFAPLLRGHVR